MLEQPYPAIYANQAEQLLLDRFAGQVVRMRNPVDRMAALPAEVEMVGIVRLCRPGKINAPIYQLPDSRGSLFDDNLTAASLHNPRPAVRVSRMCNS